MNLSCASETTAIEEVFSESGCLFFKEAGKTSITKAKFNHSVPGTLDDSHPGDPIPPMTTYTHSSWTTAPITLTTNPTTTTTIAITTFGSNLIEVGSALFYIMVGAGSGVLVLLLIILIMCLAVCYLAVDKGKSYTITTAAVYRQESQRDGRENPEQRRQPTQATGSNDVMWMEPVSQRNSHETIHLTTTSTHNTNDEEENLYAEIREQNASSPSPPPLPPPIEMTESMNEERTTIESNYQAHVSIPSHLKWAIARPPKRGGTAAELAYLYERNDAEFDLLSHPKQAGIKDAVNFVYENPTSLSLVPAPRRNSYRKAMQTNGEFKETKVGLSYPQKIQIEVVLL